MKRFCAFSLICASVLSLTVDSNAWSQEQTEDNTALDVQEFKEGDSIYVTDAVKVWTRSGPSTNHRVTGARIPGDAMSFVRYSADKKYAELTFNGDTFWMSVENLQSQPSGYTKDAMYKKELEDLRYKLENYDNELSRELKNATKKLEKLTAENAGMKEAIAQKDETIASLDETRREYADRLQTKELDMQMRWWTQGALIALCGAIAGALFIFIPRPTRAKRRDRF